MDRTRNGAPRLPGIGSHHSAVPRSDDWLTPPSLLARLGEFDTDPCSSVNTLDRIGRKVNWTIEDDGLSAPWEGRVWLNPPYSEVAPWMARMAAHGNGIALVFARTETEWWQRWVWPHAAAVLFLSGRLSFIEGRSGLVASHNAGGPSALIAYTADDHQTLRRSGLAGALVVLDEMIPGPPVSGLGVPLEHERHQNPLGGAHVEPDDRLF